MTVAHFKVLWHHLPEENEEKHQVMIVSFRAKIQSTFQLLGQCIAYDTTSVIECDLLYL